MSLALVASPVLSGCSDDNDDFPPKPEQDQAAAPKVVKTMPESGTTRAMSSDEILIEYNKKIYLTPVTTISVNGQYIDEGIKVRDEKILVIPYVTVPGNKYTVEVTNPSVRDENYNFSSTLSFTFRTKSIDILDPEMFDIAQAPVTPGATSQAVKLYELLRDNFGSRVLTGAVAQGCHDIINANILKSMTGKHPVINCFDFMEHYQSAPVNPKGWSRSKYDDVSTDTKWTNEGGIVSYQWHWHVPVDEASKDNFNNYAFYCNDAGDKNTEFTPADALTEGTWQNQILNRDIDAIAGYLLNLQQAGVPVLWRPLHEGSGNAGNYAGGKAWFWWGNSGAEKFKELWVYLFNRLQQKGVKNLIWVWTSCGNDPDWYPGDEYVDVIAVDYYENDEALFHASLIDKMEKLYTMSNHKVLALAECGAVPSAEAILEGGDIWSYMIPWNGEYTTGNKYNTPAFFKSLFEHELTMTRDEMIPIK